MIFTVPVIGPDKNENKWNNFQFVMQFPLGKQAKWENVQQV